MHDEVLCLPLPTAAAADGAAVGDGFDSWTGAAVVGGAVSAGAADAAAG